MLRELAKDLWVREQPLKLLGMKMGTRMTVVRLADGSLWLHSPVKLEDRSSARSTRRAGSHFWSRLTGCIICSSVTIFLLTHPAADAAPSPVMTALEVADYLRIHRTTLYRLAQRGQIPGFKIGSEPSRMTPLPDDASTDD